MNTVPENRHLAGKVAWVTGSSRGIGRVIASHLASLGAAVAVHGTTPLSTRAFGEGESLAALAHEIEQNQQVQALAVHGDLSDEAAVKRIATEIRTRLGRIDILVNCAGGDIGAQGVSAPGAGKPQQNNALSISLADIQSVLARNLMTCILCCREVAPEMMERHAGRIVNIGSVAGMEGVEEGAIYATAKAAVHEYTRCLAVLLRPYNVLANVVAPGYTVTPRVVAYLTSDGTIDDELMVDGGTLVRYARPIEIARAVEFFVSENNTFTTGQVWRVDGGQQTWPS